MTVIPEKHLLSRVGNALEAQSRGQHETSPSNLGAITRRMPCEPSPMPQRIPSGLSRPEQLLFLQKYLEFPFVPSFVGRCGGIVLDRVVHTLGSRGSRWWATITARLRAQKTWVQHRSGWSRRNALTDPKNYALSVCSNGRLSRSLSTHANIEFDDFTQFLSLAGGNELGLNPIRVHAHVKQQIPHHQLMAEVSLNGRYENCDSRTIEVPRAVSVHLSSSKSQSGFRYQGGLFEVMSAETKAESSRSGNAQDPLLKNFLVSKFLQFVGTFEKEVCLWKPKQESQTKSQSGGSGSSLSNFDVSRGWEKSYDYIKPKYNGKHGDSSIKKRSSYSSLLDTPYLNIGGVVGVLAQADLHSELRGQDGNVLNHQELAPGAGEDDFWTTKRIFASTGINMQFGNFSRRFLDFTSLSLKLDSGIPVQALFPEKSLSQHGMPARTNIEHPLRPFASAETTASTNGFPSGQHGGNFLATYHQERHALTASFAQQLFGPVRVRVDGRCNIELNRPAKKDPGVSTLEQLGSTVRLSQNSQPELVYGVDIALPHLGGAARLALWYSPTQREGLGEIRLL